MLNIEETELYELNEYQKSVVEEARLDILKGNTHADDEVTEKVKGWLI